MATTKSNPIAAARPPAKRSNRQAGWRAGLGSAPGQYDIWLLLIVATLVAVGLVMVFSASFIQSNRFFETPTYYLLRQLQWAAVGIVAMAVLARTDYRILKKLALLLMIGTLIVLLLVLIFGTESLGSRRHLFGRSVQPSEVAKLTIIIYIAYWLSSKGSRLKAVSDGLMPFSVLLGMVALLIVLQPDIDTTALIVFTALVMFFVAGADGKQLAIVMVIAAAIFLLVATKFSYASQRMDDYMSFLRDPTLGSDQVQYALQALAQGGLFGTGLGSGQRLVQLPFTDSIFAMIGFELGLGLILGIGITAWITLQAFLNMAVNLAMLPFSGLTLPFISYGGSSLVACLAGVGVLLSISRHGATQAAPAGATADLLTPRATGHRPKGTGSGYATLTLGWRHWRARLSHPGRARSVRPGRPTASPRSASSRAGAGNRDYTVKTASAPRADNLSRRVTRAKRTIARKTGASKRRTGSASHRQSGQRIPRRR